jgi:protocatechuate 3,4-dioxygenase beta subunit
LLVIAERLTVVLLLSSSLTFIGCGGDSLTLPSEGAPATITIEKGDSQVARVGSDLAPLEAKVEDTRGRPVAGAEVEFTLEEPADGARATPPTVTTDADGIARSTIKLGTRVGTLTGRARVPVDPGTVPVETSFTATAVSADANGIAPVSGIDQTAPVNSQLPAALVVRVTDGFGNPIQNITVEWSVEGGGNVSAATTLTDAQGQASVTRTLGSAAGEQRTLASARDLAGSPVTFIHIATAGSASRIVKVSGDGQSAATGTEVAEPLVVQVFDEANNPIAGRAVTWVIGEGGGSVSPTTSTTNAEGRASTRWTLGAAGTNTLSAVVSGMSPVTFTATASAGVPSASRSRVTVSPGTIEVGGSSTITVRVRDGSGNPVSGVSVSATSSGSGDQITPATATSGDDGVATFSFRSTSAGDKTITVVAGGVTLDDRRVISVALSASTTEITAVDPPNASTPGQSVTVSFRVTGENGGTPTGTVSVYSLQESGVGCTLPAGQGSCQMVLTVEGSHQIEAVYSGDSQFESSSDAVTHVVGPATPTNSPPVAQDDGYSTPAGTTLSVPEPGVLANDRDPDGDNLIALNASDPPQGSVSLSQDGSFTYTPDPTAGGSDSFTYQVSDGELTSTATVTITF